jgi:hypothetical protein
MALNLFSINYYGMIEENVIFFTVSFYTVLYLCKFVGLKSKNLNPLCKLKNQG